MKIDFEKKKRNYRAKIDRSFNQQPAFRQECKNYCQVSK